MDLANDADYYRRRQATARDLAARSGDHQIRRIHLDMAERYEALAQAADGYPDGRRDAAYVATG